MSFSIVFLVILVVWFFVSISSWGKENMSFEARMLISVLFVILSVAQLMFR